MKTYRRKIFGSYQEPFWKKSHGNVVFEECKFVGLTISSTLNVKHRSTIRDVKITNCWESGCDVGCAIIEDTLIDGLITSTPLQVWGAVFKHVTLKGKIGRIMARSTFFPAYGNAKQLKGLNEANSEYYANIDWALDIREAKFVDADLRGVPAQLVRRDPETQFILTREKALSMAWKEIDLSGTYWAGYIKTLLDFGDEDEVLVAPKASTIYKRELEGLLKLRDAGIVE
jgi:hypothetical protein